VHGGRVLHHHHVVALRATEAEFGDRGRAVGQQALPVLRVGPGPGHHPGPVHRADLGFVAVDGLVDEPLGDQSPLGQQRLKRRDPLFHRRHRRRAMRALAHAGSR
jgi:hypothetical protein